MRALIIEDESLNREVLRNLLRNYCPDVTVIAEADSVASGILALDAHKVELVFLDIELGDGTAFDMLGKLDNFPFRIIFTTAYDQYALRAIKFNALDYLLKPIDPDELKLAVEKLKDPAPARPHLDAFVSNWATDPKDNPVITLSTSDSFEYIPVRDIIRCEAQGAYTRFHIREKGALLVSKTLKEYEPLLQPFSFFRPHQSHLINLHEVVRYMKTDGGYVILKDGTRIGVARTRRDQFLDAMRNLRQ